MGQNGTGGRVPSVVSAAAPACLVWKGPQLQGPGVARPSPALGPHPFPSRPWGAWGDTATPPSQAPCVCRSYTPAAQLLVGWTNTELGGCPAVCRAALGPMRPAWLLETLGHVETEEGAPARSQAPRASSQVLRATSLVTEREGAGGHFSGPCPVEKALGKCWLIWLWSLGKVGEQLRGTNMGVLCTCV